ncbi:hypothetical protein FRC10_009762 [Ceratobasidium sp. 414]|nr:hypothetical protein FRC10_009762 [Ceratobasidium sp. 414]
MSSSHFGVISAPSDSESPSGSASRMSDSDYEVVLVAQATATLNVSDSDSGSFVSTPTDFVESSDDEHIFVPNVSQSAPNTPRPPSLVRQPLTMTPRLISAAIARPIVESGHDSDASDREDDSSVNSSYDSDSDGDVVYARARTVTNISDRLEAPIVASGSTVTLMAHPNASAATIRPAVLARPFAVRRSIPASMHAPAITTNTIIDIVSAAPLSPPTPSDCEEIPYVPFTAAPTAVPVPISISPPTFRPVNVKPPVAEPAIPTGKVGKKPWTTMNVARLKLGLAPLTHALRKQRNAALQEGKKERKEKEAAEKKKEKEAEKGKGKEEEAEKKKRKAQRKAQAKAQQKAAAKPKAGAKKAKSVVAPRATVGASPVSSEDEAPRMRASMFSTPVRSESPDDEAAYDAAIQQLSDHMSSPPENPTATYRYLLNRALLLEFRVCTPDTLPTSHGAAIAMVKSNIHINVLDYVAKRKEGFSGLHSVMLKSAKALRKDIRKRKMPVKQVKSLGLHSLLVLRH